MYQRHANKQTHSVLIKTIHMLLIIRIFANRNSLIPCLCTISHAGFISNMYGVSINISPDDT